MNQITEMIDPVTGDIIDERQIAEQLLAQAKKAGRQPRGIDEIVLSLTARGLTTGGGRGALR